jgi:tripartite-type tricarboxylate transporter receptor subunit TctC
VLAAAGVAINPSLYREVRFDPVKDFAAITHGISVPNILIVHPSVAATSLKDLILLGKSKPVNFASAGNGSSGHLALEQFKTLSGMQITHIPYKGGGPALAEVIGGQVQALFSLALAATPQIKAGKVRWPSPARSARAWPPNCRPWRNWAFPALKSSAGSAGSRLHARRLKSSHG